MLLPALAFLPAIPDTSVNLRIAEGALDLIGWAFLVYAAGAGAQDIAAIVTTRSARPYAPEASPGPPPTQAGPTTVTVVNPPPAEAPTPPPTDNTKLD